MHLTDAERLARASLGYLALMIAIITLAPFRFASAPVQGLSWVLDLRDVALNVVLFVPLGFVHQLARPRGAAPDWVRALAGGAALSAMIEGAQLFSPSRYPSLSDLLTNASGAALGTWLAARATRGVEGARAVRAFALDLPLVGLTYLLVPLFWLVGLSADHGALVLLALPLASAAWIIASVHAAHAATGQPGTTRPIVDLTRGALLFLAIALLPTAGRDPAVLLWGGATFGIVMVVRLRAPRAWTQGRTVDGERSRRFEAPTLRVALPPLIIFAAAFALWPVDQPLRALSSWRGMLAIMPPGLVPDDASIFRAMAHVSVFIVLGYALAERQGRATEVLSAIAPRVLAWSVVLATTIEFVRGLRAGTPASALMLIFSTGAALLGAWFYLLQLRHVQTLLGRRGSAGPTTQPTA